MKCMDLMEYVVTFNDYVGDYELGESRMASTDYTGDDIRELAEEVIASDPNYPMTFKQVDEDDNIVGLFYGTDEDYPTAAMYKT